MAIEGISKPNQQQLTILNRELNACAITVQSYHRNGALDYPVMTCVPAEFETLNGVIPVVAPLNPGVTRLSHRTKQRDSSTC